MAKKLESRGDTVASTSEPRTVGRRRFLQGLVTGGSIVIGTIGLEYLLRHRAHATYNQTAQATNNQTELEAAAGVTIVNASYKQGHILRYANNTSPGVTDMTDAFQSAVNSWGAAGGVVTIPRGKTLISGAIDISVPQFLSIEGEAGQLAGSDDATCVIYCGTVGGYIFKYSGLGRELRLKNLGFDGRNGAAAGYANDSRTLTGILTDDGVLGANLFVDNVQAWGSRSTAPQWNISKLFFWQFNECRLSSWGRGQLVKSVSGGGITTGTFRKCYFNQARECVALGYITDVNFHDCVFESCVVAVAAIGTTVTFFGGYFENIGYDYSGTGLKTGLTERDFGVTDTPAITGNVDSAITLRNAQALMLGVRLGYLNATIRQWVEGIGAFGGIEALGEVRLINCSNGEATGKLFKTNQTDRGSFSYVVEDARSLNAINCAVRTYADARLVNEGTVCLPFSDSSTRRQIRVIDGKFLVRPGLNGFAAVPVAYPLSGQWNVGDEVERTVATQVVGGEKSWVCSLAGTTGALWDTKEFIPNSKAASVAAAGTTTFSGTVSEVGASAVWEVSGTSNDTSIGYRARVIVSKLARAVAANVIEDHDSGTTSIALTTAADTYVLTLTNSNAGTWKYYARLISVHRAH